MTRQLQERYLVLNCECAQYRYLQGALEHAVLSEGLLVAEQTKLYANSEQYLTNTAVSFEQQNDDQGLQWGSFGRTLNPVISGQKAYMLLLPVLYHVFYCLQRTVPACLGHPFWRGHCACSACPACHHPVAPAQQPGLGSPPSCWPGLMCLSRMLPATAVDPE